MNTDLAMYATMLPLKFAKNFGERFTLVGFRPLSINPADDFLWVVIGLRVDGTFAKWIHNAADGGFCRGHYDLDLERALELFK